MTAAPRNGRQLEAGRYGALALQPGDMVETDEVTVAAPMIDAFAELSGDRFAIHMDAAAAQEMGFPRRVAHGLLVLSLIDGLKNQAPAQFDAVASLGWDWVFVRPVLSDDRIRARFSIAGIRMTSDGTRGILTIDVVVTNQDDAVVQKGVNRLMVRR